MATRAPIRKNLFGFGRKPAPAETKPRRGRGGLSLSEAGRAAMKAGRKSGDLSDFDSWMEARHLETRSDGFVSRVRDSYKRGVEAAEADEQNREFLKAKREQAREAAREAKAAARERPKSKATAGASTMPSEAAIQAGFKRGLSLNEILAQNPSLRAFKKSNPSKFDRCVKAVQKRGGDVNAYAVCTAAGTRKNPNATTVKHEREIRKYIDDKKAIGWSNEQLSRAIWRRWGYSTDVKSGQLRVKFSGGLEAFNPSRKNPASAAAEVFEDFHGFQPTEVITVTKKVHHHAHLASLGILVYLEVWGIDKVGHTLSGFKKAILACNEDRNQLFIEGGDQTIDLSDFGIRQGHELETLGKVLTVAYSTDKKHLGNEGGKAVYVHDFTTTNENGKHVKVPEARLPQLIYDVRNEQLLFSGGSYEIIAEGIDK